MGPYREGEEYSTAAIEEDEPEKELWEACTAGDAQTVEWLLLHYPGINVNYQDGDYRRTPLYRACGHGRTGEEEKGEEEEEEDVKAFGGDDKRRKGNENPNKQTNKQTTISQLLNFSTSCSLSFLC